MGLRCNLSRDMEFIEKEHPFDTALYQFHLVKAEIARAIIPKEFKLVEAFGYTLGGFFLANYNESPFGTFDELVVIAGIVWNPPTSHAWAARVYVNSDEACRHGRKEFGLPSQIGRFTKNVKAVSKSPQRNDMDIQVAEIDGHVATNLYDIRLTSPVTKTNPLKWMFLGPNIKMSLPSFSGHTKHKPQLLKYSCQIECRVQPTSIAKVLRRLDQNNTSESQNVELNESIEKREMSISVMLSKPILALEFNCLKMEVEPPVVVSKGSHGF
ncbi:protein neoxanthin-deficient 1 [Tanacetum coccineum]